MFSSHRGYRNAALLCALFFVLSIFACLSPRVAAQPDHLIRRTRKEGREKQQEEKEEKKQDDEKKKDDSSGTSSATVKNYYHYRDDRYETHYSFWSPTYERVVDIYFHEAYGRLNEGFFYDIEKGIEYLPGEWFDMVLNFECYAVVGGEDIKIRYTVYNLDNEELYFGKEFRPIYSGPNEKTIFHAFPARFLAEYKKLYIDIILTIEGNDAYGGFWLETLPVGNEGPLRVGDVVVADNIPGGESNPRYNLLEGNEYKIFAEYEIDYYLGDMATVEWRIYDSNGQTIIDGTDYIEPRAGYGYFTTAFAIPELDFSGTRNCYLDVSIIAAPYLGRRIMELKVTGDGVVNPSAVETPRASLTPAQPNSPYEVTFTYAEVLPIGGAKPGEPLMLGQELYAIVEYYIAGLPRDANEQFKWSLYREGELLASGTQSNVVNDGKQNRSIKLPISDDKPPGEYVMHMEIWLDGISAGTKEISFNLAPGKGNVAVEVESDDENYFEFPGFTLFLPYEWEATGQNQGLGFKTENGIKGQLNPHTLSGPDKANSTLSELVDEFETDIAGVKLTRQSRFAGGREIISTVFLQMQSGKAKTVDLYGYFIANESKDSVDFWVIEMSAKADDIGEIYDDFDIIVEGLFFPGD